MSTLTYFGLNLEQHKEPGNGKKWTRLVASLRTYNRRYQQRQQLLQLSDFMLKDIGISRVDAIKEASKHFWQD